MNDYFIEEERNLKFLFHGKCSIQRNNSPGIKSIYFEVGLRTNGTIIGRLDLTLDDDHSLDKVRNYFSDTFDLEGQDEVTGLRITMEKCFVRNFNGLTNKGKISFDFLPLEMILGKDNLDRTISGTAKFHFGLTNVFDVNRIKAPEMTVRFSNQYRTLGEFNLSDFNKLFIDTSLGELEFYNYSNIDEKERTMLNFRLPLITAKLSIVIIKNNFKINEVRKEIVEIVEDFLWVSSFVQSCKHDWKFVLIESKDKPVFVSIRSTKTSIPFYLPLNNGINDPMYNSLWKGFSSSGFKQSIALAVDWYLESIVGQEIESKILNLSTALECLMDAYHKANNSEFILNETDFLVLKKKMIPAMYRVLHEIGFTDHESEEFSTIRNSFENLRRRTYVNKFRLLLSQLQIDYSDVKLNPAKIASIRNDVTHRGQLKHINEERKLRKLYEHQYKALWSVLIRIFLKLLMYDGRYFDPYFKSSREVLGSVGAID